MKKAQITTVINGREYTRTVDVNRTLVEFLREDLFLTGTKEGCDEGECGACTVLMEGKPVNSCLLLAAEADGREITTIEGMSGDGRLHPIQQAFVDIGAVQCGYCIPGMILSAKAILDEFPEPTEEQIRTGIEGNLCRCTGYNRIVEGIMLAAKRINEK